MNSDEIDQKQLKVYRDDFLKLSRLRFGRMESTMSMKQADCLKLLPLLFHVNHPMLPGYVDRQTPSGLPNYSPSKIEKTIAKTISQSFLYKPRAHLSYKISSLFLMGSMGTLAQSYSSDIDLWICLGEALPNKLLVKLKQKATHIKEWLASIGIELNFYCVNSDDFSRKKNKTLEVDSCGNTQNYLLLDEFYRTSVWLAGRWPLWWVIPEDKDYPDYAKRLVEQKHIDALDWIDFGEVKTIPAAEYFSAALWQLYKAIESPYKSSVKLLVLEVYAQLHPCTGVLSNQLKAHVFNGDVLKQELDPYLQILFFAQNALKNNSKRLEFLRRAFYLKANLKITNNKTRKSNWRYKLIHRLVEDWGWKPERLDYLNRHHRWNIHEVKGERTDLIKELTNSYHFLSGFSRVQGVIDRVAKNELLSLGRRLYSNFERRAGKIERVNTGIVKDSFESGVTLLQEKNKWSLYLGHIQQKSKRLHQTAFEGRSLFECICWGCFNEIISRNTRLHVYQRDDCLNLQLANDINRDLLKLIKIFNALGGQQNFDKEAKTIGFGIFINTQNDPLSKEKQEDLYHIANQSDCFNWAEGKVNLASQFDVVFLNSWGELTTQVFEGDTAWIEFFAQYNNDIDLSNGDYPIYCRRLVQKEILIDRVRGGLLKWQQLVANSNRSGYANRHIMSIKGNWLLADIYQSTVKYELYSSFTRLYGGLSVSCHGGAHAKIHLDPHAKASRFCERVFKRRLPTGLDFYLHQRQRGSIEVLVVSFSGCVHHQIHKKSDRDQVIGHYQQFFDKIQNRNLLNHGLLETICYYEFVEKISKKAAHFKPVELQPVSAMQQFLLVQAIAVSDRSRPMINNQVNRASTKSNRVVFDLFTAESSFSCVEYGDLAYQKLQKQLLKMREKNADYPIFLTDLDLSAVLSKVSIIEALGFKKEIERKLNKGLS